MMQLNENINGGIDLRVGRPGILTHAAKTVRNCEVARLDSEEFSGLVDLIYSAATDFTQWTDVTRTLRKAFDAPYTLIFGFDPPTAGVPYAASSGLSADALKQGTAVELPIAQSPSPCIQNRCLIHSSNEKRTPPISSARRRA